MAAVSVVIPSYQDLKAETRVALTLMVYETQCRCGDHKPWECTRGKHDVLWLPQVGSSIIHWARDNMVALALYADDGRPQRPPSEYFLLMDDDMLVETHHLKRLLLHKKDIVGGICTVRRDPPVPTLRYWDATTGCFNEPVEWDWDAQKLIEVDACGAAFLLVRRRVLERMAEAYLDCMFEREWDARRGYPLELVSAYWDRRAAARRKRFDDAGANGWRKKDCWWFGFIKGDDIHENTHGELGEDISFCWRARKLGYRIFVDPQVLPGHLGYYGYSCADYRDYVERRKAEGKIIALTENHPQIGSPIETVDAAGGVA